MNNDTPASQTTPRWITEQELSQHLQVSVRHLINLRKAGLPHIVLGSSIRYDLSEVEAFIRTNRRLSSHVARQQRRKALDAK